MLNDGFKDFKKYLRNNIIKYGFKVYKDPN